MITAKKEHTFSWPILVLRSALNALTTRFQMDNMSARSLNFLFSGSPKVLKEKSFCSLHKVANQAKSSLLKAPCTVP